MARDLAPVPRRQSAAFVLLAVLSTSVGCAAVRAPPTEPPPAPCIDRERPACTGEASRESFGNPLGFPPLGEPCNDSPCECGALESDSNEPSEAECTRQFAYYLGETLCLRDFRGSSNAENCRVYDVNSYCEERNKDVIECAYRYGKGVRFLDPRPNDPSRKLHKEYDFFLKLRRRDCRNVWNISQYTTYRHLPLNCE